MTFEEACDAYEAHTGKDPRIDDDGNPRPQVQIIKTLAKFFT